MSASLVGSEMCIRDRCAGHHGGGAPTPGRGRPLQPLCDSRCHAHSPRACLLYTSDAADDM
eukprot:14781510-Alexandrium_andersonii.AAC.1